MGEEGRGWGRWFLCRSGRDCCGVFCVPYEKTAVFLTVPSGHASANAAKTPHAATWESAAFVRQAAKGGRILAWRSSKKHRRFFIWNTKSPHSSPGRNDTETTSLSPPPPPPTARPLAAPPRPPHSRCWKLGVLVAGGRGVWEKNKI